MNYGSFDDRDNARRHVKLWMQNNHPGDYTVGNVMGLARHLVANDSEPVDDIHVQWAETSYGLLRGIVEFAADQLSADHAGYGRDSGVSSSSPESRMKRAAAAAHEAAAALPYRTDIARRHLVDAMDVLGAPDMGASSTMGNLQRAPTAISLALMMLGTPAGRSVAA